MNKEQMDLIIAKIYAQVQSDLSGMLGRKLSGKDRTLFISKVQNILNNLMEEYQVEFGMLPRIELHTPDIYNISFMLFDAKTGEELSLKQWIERNRIGYDSSSDRITS